MKTGDLPLGEFDDCLAEGGLRVRLGPFNIKIRSDLNGLAAVIRRLYRSYPIPSLEEITDFHVEVTRPRGLRRWIRTQCRFTLDGRSPFAPYPVAHALPALEWGINWCIATRAHHLLMLHAAVVERDGYAILFPAWPGHGKSTLCAALIHSGWRLLSDEFGLVRPEDGMLIPCPRLIPLKNESIDVIGRFCPESLIGPSFHGTRKGTVAHVKPPDDSIARADEPAKPGWLIFPRWTAGVPLALEPVSKSEAFLMVATNAFNYEFLDETAFRLVTEIVRASNCYSLRYSDLHAAVAAIESLTNSEKG